MVKSEIGTLDGNIFFPCISKSESLYSNSETTNAYGIDKKTKTKKKPQMTSYDSYKGKTKSLYNR